MDSSLDRVKRMLLVILGPVSCGITFALLWLVTNGRFPNTDEWLLFTVIAPFVFGALYWIAAKLTPRR
jgi:hypothetical protein